MVCPSCPGSGAPPRVVPNHFLGFRQLLRAKRARGRGSFALSYGRRRILSDPHTLLVLTVSVSRASGGTYPETHAQCSPSPPLSFSCQALDGGTRKAARDPCMCACVCRAVCVPTPAYGVRVHITGFPCWTRASFCLPCWFGF